MTDGPKTLIPKDNSEIRKLSEKEKLFSEATARVQNQLADGALMPHEILWSIAQGKPVPIGVDGHLHFPDLEQVISAAKSAAPYFAPKLQSTSFDVSGSDEGAFSFTLSIDGGRQPKTEPRDVHSLECTSDLETPPESRDTLQIENNPSRGMQEVNSSQLETRSPSQDEQLETRSQSRDEQGE